MRKHRVSVSDLVKHQSEQAAKWHDFALSYGSRNAERLTLSFNFQNQYRVALGDKVLYEGSDATQAVETYTNT